MPLAHSERTRLWQLEGVMKETSSGDTFVKEMGSKSTEEYNIPTDDNNFFNKYVSGDSEAR